VPEARGLLELSVHNGRMRVTLLALPFGEISGLRPGRVWCESGQAPRAISPRALANALTGRSVLRHSTRGGEIEDDIYIRRGRAIVICREKKSVSTSVLRCVGRTWVIGTSRQDLVLSRSRTRPLKYCR